MAPIPELWRTLSLAEPTLGDDEFLRQFQPLLDRFLDREADLTHCAQGLSDLYDLSGGCRILEPASGCDVFPSILRRLGADAIGLEARDTPTSRYCTIKRLPMILVDNWTSPWGDDVFDLVVVTGYITDPDAGGWGSTATLSFCENVSRQVARGAELVLFDLRYVVPLIEAIRVRAWPIDWEKAGGHRWDAVMFFRQASARQRRKRGLTSPPAS